VKYLHDNDIVHRDLKYVILDASDFGMPLNLTNHQARKHIVSDKRLRFGYCDSGFWHVSPLRFPAWGKPLSSLHDSVLSIFIPLRNSCIRWREVSVTLPRKSSTKRGTGNPWISGQLGTSPTHFLRTPVFIVPLVSLPMCCFAVTPRLGQKTQGNSSARRWPRRSSSTTGIGKTFLAKVRPPPMPPSSLPARRLKIPS